MNAYSPSKDLLSDAFKCSGSVTAASPPWKAEAIAGLESRLAAALTAELCKPKAEQAPKVNVQPVNSKADDAAVLAVITRPIMFSAIALSVDLDNDTIHRALLRLRGAGKITATRQQSGGHRCNIYSPAEPLEPIQPPPPVEPGMSGRTASSIANRAKIRALRDAGVRTPEIVYATQLARSYVMRILAQLPPKRQGGVKP